MTKNNNYNNINYNIHLYYLQKYTRFDRYSSKTPGLTYLHENNNSHKVIITKSSNYMISIVRFFRVCLNDIEK